MPALAPVFRLMVKAATVAEFVGLKIWKTAWVSLLAA